MPLTGIAASVTKADVGVLLIARDPQILDGTYGEDAAPLFDAYVNQIAAEVIPVVGSDPTAGPIRDLAVQCIAYGVGSQVEYAEFPEQQTAGNIGRGWFLKQKFTELLNTLRSMPNGAGPGTVPAGISRGNFPPPLPYPDPVRPFYRDEYT